VRGGLGRDLIYRGVDRLPLDLGQEPPLSASGAKPVEPNLIKGTISWRWLGGTVLTGVTSFVLMGVALVAALNDPRQFASLSEASASVSPTAPDSIVFGRKGDRIRPIQEPVATRQVMQVSTVTRQGASDLIKLRPFAKISTTLAGPTDGTAAAKQIPAFDMLHIFGDGGNAAAVAAPSTLDDQFYGAKVQGDVSVKISDFPVAAREVEPASSLSTSEVEQIVRKAAGTKGAQSGPTLAYLDAGPARPDPAALAVRIEVENVSSISKSNTGNDGVGGITEKVVTVPRESELGALLQANGVAAGDAAKVVSALSPLVDVAKLKPGQKIRLAYVLDGANATARLARASVYQDSAHLATVARADNESFVRADEPLTPIDVVVTVNGPTPVPTNGGMPRIYEAVYATALSQQMPKPLVEQLIRILAFDVDLQARIAPGDAMQIFHSLSDPAEKEASDPEILFASLTLGGVTKRFYRFRTGDDGAVDYYDQDGKSAKKFLLRKPVVEAEITSGFGYRVHPILGERILHSGIDYAAARMTPIFAAGDGVIEEAGPNAGYGNFILIRHTNGYETAYGHMTKFATGMKEGVRVRQGQIIGYVGSTGLSTGPHVHFEIRINDTPVDPLRVRLPQGRVLAGDPLHSFEVERARIDTLLGIEQPSQKQLASATQPAPKQVASAK
jgi:murein DD-endopeptidase MepM/ murein hydrolase activator NlpD